MMMTSQQIQSLFTFCEKHFVKYYDVQVELVDHLANAIEKEMREDSKLSFEKALEKVHKGFGIMGFAPLVAEKQNMAQRQTRKLFWKLLKEQFGWPKILIFLLVSTSMYTLISAHMSLIKWVTALFVLSIMIIYFRIMYELQKLEKTSGKKLLIVNFSWISAFLLIPIYLINFSNFIKVFFPSAVMGNPNLLSAGISIFLGFYIVTLISLSRTIDAIKKSVYQNYPEIFLRVSQ
jgi:cation transport ATPase